MSDASRALGELGHVLLRRQEGLTLSAANGIWVSPSTKLLPGYAAAQRATFGARVESRDFSDPATLSAINKWFAARTRNLIPKMLSELSPDTGVVLANALYFKAKWQVPFKVAETSPAPFHVPGKSAADTPLMHHAGEEFPYKENEDYQAVRLPFAGDGLEMIIALPREERDAATWVKALDAKGWDGLLGAADYAKQPGDLALPRLKLASGGDMRPTLELIGFKKAFGEGADFTRLARSRIHLDQVVHRAALNWDEEGAEAAAATAVIGVRSAMVPVGRFKMTVDRPFVFVLRDLRTGTVVLLGLVNDPGQAGT
jgi:serpin B